MKGLLRAVRVVGVLAAVGASLDRPPEAAAGVCDGWAYRASVTFEGYTKNETLTNFPVLVRLGPGPIADFRYSQLAFPSNAADLRFLSSDENTELAYEIERWDTNGTSLAWVRVPALSSAADSLWIFWGKPGVSPPEYATNGLTWAPAYTGVWHLADGGAEEAGALVFRDSTSNHLDGADYVTSTGKAGQIGLGQTVSSDYILVSPSPVPLTHTISCWFQLTNAFQVSRGILSCGSSINDTSPYFILQANGTALSVYAHIVGYTVIGSVTGNRWYHFALVRTPTLLTAYLDGVLQTSWSAGTDGNNTSLFLGAGYASPVDGDLDEVRVSTSLHSSNWVWACWLNQASNAAFCRYGALEGLGWPVIANDPVSNVSPSSAWLNGHLGATGGSPVAISVYWGDNDGGAPTSGLWDTATPLGGGPWTNGMRFTQEATSLTEDRYYFYRYYATNSTQAGWAESTERFLAGRVWVTVEEALARENSAVPPSARFVLHRALAATNEPLAVSFRRSGMAVEGVDYTAVPAGTNATFPAGSSTVAIAIVPVWDGVPEGEETVSLELLPGPYAFGTPASNTVTLADEEPFPSWGFMAPIRFTGYTRQEALTNFPVLVQLGPGVISGFRYAQFGSPSDGADLRFVTANRLAELPYEIERWDTNGISLAWVRVPVLSNASDHIWAYWGQADVPAPIYTTNGMPWSGGYAGVWHLADGGAGSSGALVFRDSTSNRTYGADYVGSTGKSGRIGLGQTFDGGYITVDPSRAGWTNTLSCWVQLTNTTQATRGILSCGANAGDGLPYFILQINGNTLRWYAGGYYDIATVTSNSWYHVAIVRRPGQATAYLDGQPQTPCTPGTSGNMYYFYLGYGYNGGVEGDLDEVRVSTVERSSNWIWACWLNQASNLVFQTYEAVMPRRAGILLQIQ